MDAAAVVAWARGGVEALGAARSSLDRVNVFPVADADTGTNMYLTFLDAARSLAPAAGDPAAAPDGQGRDGQRPDGQGPDVPGAGELLVRLARGALVGARGNSGVILSEYLRGLALALSGHDVVAGPALAEALGAAARTARGAVARPAPGTILTAADAVATAAHAATGRAGRGVAPGGAEPAEVAAAGRDAARAAVLRSRGELDVLERAQVLDAGALGLYVLLGALCAALEPAGEGVPDVVSEVLAMMSGMAPVRPAEGAGAADGPPGADEGGEFEVMYVVDATAAPCREDGGRGPSDVGAGLRAALSAVGDSVVVVGGGDGAAGGSLWQAHVHTDDPVAALAAGRAALAAFPDGAAALRQVRARHLRGHDGDPHHAPSAGARTDAPAPGRVGLVAVTTAPGLVADLARAGAVVLLHAPGTPVDAAALHRVVVDAGAPHVVLLPGAEHGGDVVAAVRAAVLADGVVALDVLDAPSDLHVVVALAATQLAGPGPAGSLVAAARAAASAVRVAAVVADGPAAPGDLPGPLEAAVADVLAGPTEVLTVLADDGVPPAVLDGLAARAAARGAEVVVLASGRAGATVALGAEPPSAAGHDAVGAGTGGASR